MATRQEKRSGFTQAQKIDLIHDDLDEGDSAFKELRASFRELGAEVRSEVRSIRGLVQSTLGTVILTLLTLVGLNIWRGL